MVVLNWNGSALLPDCLDTLAKQDLDSQQWRLWVVDNGSTDDSLELLARDYPAVHVVENGANRGFAGGNNVAMRSARTPFVVLLNNDAYPEPDWLRRLLDAAAAPGAEQVAAVTSKLVFEPGFVVLDFETPEFRASPDPRPLGARISAVEVDAVDVTGDVLWDHGAYGVEQHGPRRFRWSMPSGRLMVPLPPKATDGGSVQITLRMKADRSKRFAVRLPGAPGESAGSEHVLQVTTDDVRHQLAVPAGTATVDVINNVGSYIHEPGYAADRGYQEPDTGQYDRSEDVFLMCGAAVCLRSEALREVGVFDDDFFMYYEDTDLSWRLQAAGWSIRYAADAVVRHRHSASSGEWSPFFTFHVERNRLLVFTKNAPARFAAWLVLRFNLTTLSMMRRAVVQGLRQRRRPALRPLFLRVRVTLSYLRLLPRALARRRRIARSARHNAQTLFDRWMLSSKPET